jgi:hypothetical protein
VGPDEPRFLEFRHHQRGLRATHQIPAGFTGRLTVRLEKITP